MYDAPPVAVETQQLDAELRTVLLQLRDLPGRAVADSDLEVSEAGHRSRRGRVVHGCEREVGAPNRQTEVAEEGECLGCGYFVDQVQVDIQDRRGPGRLRDDDVIVPDLVEQRGGDSHQIRARSMLAVESGSGPPSCRRRRIRFMTSRQARQPASTMSTLVPWPR